MDNELNFYITFYSFVLIYAVINMLLQSILFKRAGVGAWKAFVPFYGGFTLHKLAFGEEAKWFWFLNLVLQDIYGIYQRYSFVKSFEKSTGFAILAIFFPRNICLYDKQNRSVEYTSIFIFILKMNRYSSFDMNNCS